MLVKTMTCCVAILFVLSAPAEALFGGGGRGGGGGKGGGGSKGSSSSSSKSSSKSSSRSRGGGGLSIGASAGRGGISAGASVGGARAGASIGGGGVRAGASLGGTRAGASLGGGSGLSAGASVGGLSAGTRVNSDGVAASVSGGDASLSVNADSSGLRISAGTGDDGPAPNAPTSAIAAANAAAALVLPWELLPRSSAGCDTARECAILQTGRAAAIGAPGNRGRLDIDPGTPVPVVTACQRAAAQAAQGYGALMVEAASAGRVRPTGQGGIVAPVNLRITYAQEGGGRQVREAEIGCTMNAGGQVVALT